MGFKAIRGRWFPVMMTGAMILSACSHVESSRNQDPDWLDSAAIPAPKVLGESAAPDDKITPAKNMTIDHGDITIRGVKLKNVKFDFPLVVNSRVEYWIDYFCGRGRPYFQKYLERSEYFIPYILPILKQYKVPEDLVYLAMIESGFNNLARSHARAVGPWQFISATGKRYGLKVNWWIDERRDIGKSTVAAVGYLKDLYEMFQSWELAAAAYNAGEAKLARAVQRFGTKDFWVIARHRFLRPETRDYVPKIIAAAIIAKNRTQFGFPQQTLKPSSDEAVAGDGEVVKLVKSDQPEADREYQAQRAIDESEDTDFDEDADSESPAHGAAGVMPASFSEPVDVNPITSGEVRGPMAKSIPTPHVTKQGEVGGEELVEFEVQSPADLLKVASAAGLSYATVKALNPEILRWCTPPNVKSFRIKLPQSVKDKFLVTYNHEAFPRQVQFMTYKVRSGETLNRIARHFGIKVDPMSDLNRVSPLVPLRKGAQVLLPMPNDRSRSFASLEVRDPPEKRRRKGRRHRRSIRMTSGSPSSLRPALDEQANLNS